jgi:AraC-like DNA-binding protein
MNKSAPTDLTISPGERKKLRAARVPVKELHLHPIDEITDILQCSKLRAMELAALSEFQSVPSVGVRFAHNLISMGYYNLNQLKNKDGARLTDQFEVQEGVWADPCLEDQFRLVVYHAKHPGSQKKWWDFTGERKLFRAKNGYPVSRPTKPWFEVARFRSKNFLKAKKEDTKDDLQAKLRKALKFMKKNAGSEITLQQLADVSHLSSYHFLRCFKSAYAQTPFEYLGHLRLKLACKLLRETKMPVNAVCLKCGFGNESSFSRMFRKKMQTTPVEFRKSNGFRAGNRRQQNRVHD